MWLFNFFNGNKKHKKEKINEGEPSSEQIFFAKSISEIAGRAIEQFGFKRITIEINTYSTNILYRKENQFIRINSTSHWHDNPCWYDIILGEGESEDASESKWNSISVLEILNALFPENTFNCFLFSFENEKMLHDITEAKNYLLKYAHSFLDGDLTFFYEMRKKINEKKEPTQFIIQGKDGSQEIFYSKKSLEQKKKYT